MAQPQAYAPIHGQQYQILSRYQSMPYDHCDYAKDRKELKYLMENYRLAYQGTGTSFKIIPLPRKYWKEKEKTTQVN